MPSSPASSELPTRTLECATPIVRRGWLAARSDVISTGKKSKIDNPADIPHREKYAYGRSNTMLKEPDGTRLGFLGNRLAKRSFPTSSLRFLAVQSDVNFAKIEFP